MENKVLNGLETQVHYDLNLEWGRVCVWHSNLAQSAFEMLISSALILRNMFASAGCA